MIVHVGDFAFTGPDVLHNHAHESFGNIDGEVFDRFHQLARFFVVLGDDLRLAHHQFITLAAHHLDQNRKLQLAAAENLERVRAARLFHAQRDVGEQFLIQPLAQVARSNVVAFASAKRRSVDGEQHRNRRLVDDDRRERRGILRAGNGFSNRDAFDARDGNNVAERCLRNVGALQAREAEELGDLCLVKCPVALGDGNVFARLHGPGKNAGNGQAPQVVAVIEVSDQNLKRPVSISLRRGNGIDDRVKQRT